MVTDANRSGRPSVRPGAVVVAVTLLVAAALAWWLRPEPRARPQAQVERAWALEHQAAPTQLWVGGEVEVPVTIRNLGEAPWDPELGDRLAYHWRSESGELTIRDGLRTVLPSPVGSGEAIELRARLQAPDEPGRYQLEWALVREDVTWFPPPQGGPRYHAVEVGTGELGWGLVRELRLPAQLDAGELVSVAVELHNLGDVAWDPAHGDALAYHWWSDEGAMWAFEGRRTELPGPVGPGETVTVELEVVAPSHVGPEPRRMCVELEPLRERVRWFGPARPARTIGGERPEPFACTSVEPDPLGWALVTDETPTHLAVDEPPQWVQVTVRNTGTEAWTGGDQLSYRWRSLATGASFDGPRTSLPDAVEPDRVIELEALVSPPPEPGRYELRWGLIRRSRGPEPGIEEERWVPQPEPGLVTRVVEVGAARLAWALLRAEPLARVWVNRTTTVEVELRNLGTEAWAEATGDHLAYHWLDVDGRVVEQDGLRTGFKRPVGPGESITVRAQVRGPSEPGEYRLQWELVREHERWFGAPAPIGAGARWPAQSAGESTAGESTTRARWRAVVLILGFALVTCAGGVGVRLRPPTRGWARVAIEAAPLVWAWAAILILVATFHEFSAIKAGSSAWWIEASGAWIVVVPLGFTRGRVRAWLAVALVGFLAVLALADLVYMHYFGSIVPIVALTASHHLGEVGDSAVAELERVWAWLAVIPLAGFGAAMVWPRARPAELPAEQPGGPAGSRARSVWVWARPRVIAVSVGLVFAAPAMVELGVALTGTLGQRVFSEQAIVGRFGYVNAHLFDLARNLRERGRRGRASPEQLAAIRAWFEARALELAAAERVAASQEDRAIPYAAAADANLLLIQVEALQTWVIGLEVEGVEVTPLLNRWRREADWYPYLIDQTNQGKTSDAEYMVLNSQHPLGEGAVCFLRADNQFYTLAHVLAERGYATLSAHPYKRGFWNRAVLHPRYGFERSLFRRELGPGQETGWGLADGLFFARMLPVLRELPEPWFGFLITLSLHHPYDEFPDNLDSLDVGVLEGTRVGNYLEAMHYFDESLGQLLAGLDEAGLLEHTVVAIYGDHDARFELDEYPEVLSLAGIPDWDPGAFARLERVPLFVRVPSRAPAGEVDEVGGHIDIGPTLLHTLGIERPRGLVGRALVASDDGGFAAYPDGSGYSRDRVYVATGKGIPAGGGCFEFPQGDSRPLAECEGLGARAMDELGISRMVVDFDLHRLFVGE
jgi:phosphoglycerol transferase MdoB-like AlkP superfamily enzyme